MSAMKLSDAKINIRKNAGFRAEDFYLDAEFMNVLDPSESLDSYLIFKFTFLFSCDHKFKIINKHLFFFKTNSDNGNRNIYNLRAPSCSLHMD